MVLIWSTTCYLRGYALQVVMATFQQMLHFTISIAEWSRVRMHPALSATHNIPDSSGSKCVGLMRGQIGTTWKRANQHHWFVITVNQQWSRVRMHPAQPATRNIPNSSGSKCVGQMHGHIGNVHLSYVIPAN